jgi:GNAT superfamily N-acetyltransferase
MPATAISELRIAVKSSLSDAELEDANALVSEARWNQVAADWRLFAELGRVYAAYAPSGRIIATSAFLPYGERFGWISMVLVAGPYRRQGLATLLMRRAMDDLAAARLVPVLDATPEGRAVYRTLGFADSWGFHRLRREQLQQVTPVDRNSFPAGVEVRPITDADWPALCAFDAAAFGAQRDRVLGALRGRLRPAELVAMKSDRIVGFCLGRDGRVAGHIGPLVAENDIITCALLARAIDAIAGPIFIDLADTKSATREFLAARGFAPVRPFTRMLFGRAERFDDPARTFAVVGPEFG